MSDSSPCMFSRIKSYIFVNPDEGFISHLPEAGKKTFHVELTSEEWSFLSLGEFINRLTKAKLLGAVFMDIHGEDPGQFAPFLVKNLPMFRQFLPIRIAADCFRISLIEKIIESIDGVCVDIRLPLKESYTKEDRELCRDLSEKTPTQYKDHVVKMIELVDHLPLTFYRIQNPQLLGPNGVSSIIQFLSECKAPIAIPNGVK